MIHVELQVAGAPYGDFGGLAIYMDLFQPGKADTFFLEIGLDECTCVVTWFCEEKYPNGDYVVPAVTWKVWFRPNATMEKFAYIMSSFNTDLVPLFDTVGVQLYYDHDFPERVSM